MQTENTPSSNGQAQALPALPKNDDNLIWLDCEMSGLDPEKERLLEMTPATYVGKAAELARRA